MEQHRRIGVRDSFGQVVREWYELCDQLYTRPRCYADWSLALDTKIDPWQVYPEWPKDKILTITPSSWKQLEPTSRTELARQLMWSRELFKMPIAEVCQRLGNPEGFVDDSYLYVLGPYKGEDRDSVISLFAADGNIYLRLRVVDDFVAGTSLEHLWDGHSENATE